MKKMILCMSLYLTVLSVNMYGLSFLTSKIKLNLLNDTEDKILKVEIYSNSDKDALVLLEPAFEGSCPGKNCMFYRNFDIKAGESEIEEFRILGDKPSYKIIAHGEQGDWIIAEGFIKDNPGDHEKSSKDDDVLYRNEYNGRTGILEVELKNKKEKEL